MKKSALWIAALVIILSYLWLHREAWVGTKSCPKCEFVQQQHTQRLVGSIAVQPDRSMLFTELRTGFKYRLRLCDDDCTHHLNRWFEKMGFIDNEKGEPILFDIEGIRDQNDFWVLDAIFLGSGK